MNTDFKTAKELYDRVLPALNSKIKELRRNNINYIKKEDIWNYLIINVWTKEKGLDLADIVDDILNVSNNELDSYVKENMRIMERNLTLEKLDI